MSLGAPLPVAIEDFDEGVLGTPFSHTVAPVKDRSLGAPLPVAIENFEEGILGVPFSHSVLSINSTLGAPLPVAIENFDEGVLGTPFSHEVSITAPNLVNPIRGGWPNNRAAVVQTTESDVIILSQLGRNDSGFGSIYGRFDDVTTEVDIGTGSAVTQVNIGQFGNTVFNGSLEGNLNVDGEFSIISQILLMNRFTNAIDHSILAVERGSSGDDAVVQWNEAQDRFEFGLFDTLLGTVAPAASANLSDFVDLKINDLNLSGTTIEAPQSLSISTTGAAADLTLGARSNTITLNESGDTSLSGFTATSIFGAINELADGNFSSNITNNISTYISGEFLPLEIGEILYVSDTDTVRLAIASATLTSNAADPSKIVGVASESMTSGETNIKVIGEGTASVKFEPSLTLSAGDEIFISASISGSATNIIPTGSGNIIQSIGFVKNASAYDGNSSLNAIVHLTQGNRISVA